MEIGPICSKCGNTEISCTYYPGSGEKEYKVCKGCELDIFRELLIEAMMISKTLKDKIIKDLEEGME